MSLCQKTGIMVISEWARLMGNEREEPESSEYGWPCEATMHNHTSLFHTPIRSIIQRKAKS